MVSKWGTSAGGTKGGGGDTKLRKNKNTPNDERNSMRMQNANMTKECSAKSYLPPDLSKVSGEAEGAT